MFGRFIEDSCFCVSNRRQQPAGLYRHRQRRARSCPGILAPAKDLSVTITLQQLDMRVGRVPALRGLKAGLRSSLPMMAASPGAVWLGTYTYYNPPAAARRLRQGTRAGRTDWSP